MTQAPKTYITPEMRARVGVESEPVNSEPVTKSDIRRWAIAAWYPERPPRVYWDEEYAKKTRYKGIIAPPDLNPFAWPIEEKQFNEVIRRNLGGTREGSAEPGTRPLNAGSEVEYYRPLRPGDVITSVEKIVSLTERIGSRTGLMLFTTREARWTNQKGELVRIMRRVGISY